MVIRAYTENDADALTDIWYRATLTAHSFIPTELWDEHKGDLKSKYLPVAETWVAVVENRIVGFISLIENYIGGLFVDPSVQGKGIGSALMKHAQDKLDNLTVSVYKENPRARKFYERNGFVYQAEEIQEETGHILVAMAWKRSEGAYKRAFDQSRLRLQALKPDEIAARSLCKFDELRNCFLLTSFGEKIQISYPDGIVRFTDTETELPRDWSLILLNYLSSSMELPLAGYQVSYRELPMGNVFYPNIRTHVLQALGDFYTSCNKQKLLEVLVKSGFSPVKTKADLAVDGSFAPRVPVMIRFWEGEEDIPSSCQILFDRTVSEQMHIEDIAALCGIVRHFIETLYQEAE